MCSNNIMRDQPYLAGGLRGKEISHCDSSFCSLVFQMCEISSPHMLFSLGLFITLFLSLFSFWHPIYLPYFPHALLSTVSLNLVCKINLAFHGRIVHLPASFCFSPKKHLPQHLPRLGTHMEGLLRCCWVDLEFWDHCRLNFKEAKGP